MRKQFSMIATLAAAWLLFMVQAEAVPLSFQSQLNVALQKIAELKGDAFDNCCNVSHIILYILMYVGNTYSSSEEIVIHSQDYSHRSMTEVPGLYLN